MAGRDERTGGTSTCLALPCSLRRFANREVPLLGSSILPAYAWIMSISKDPCSNMSHSSTKPRILCYARLDLQCAVFFRHHQLVRPQTACGELQRQYL